MPTYSDAELAKLTEQLAECLLAKQYKVVTVESCTGGWLAKCCTDMAGSSNWFEHGFVTYSNTAKQQYSHVTARTLLRFGAVSQQTATEMASGALKNSNADIAVAITGIAGPGGATTNKPIGKVCFAVAIAKHHCNAYQYQFSGDREQVRRHAVATAIELILENIKAL